MESMGYLEPCTALGQTAAEIQARPRLQLNAREDAAGRTRRRRPSDSDSWRRPQPNYAAASGVYGCSASARRATARRGRKLSLFVAVLFFAVSGVAQAATINAASCSEADVTTAMAATVDGDTVLLPAGTATWSSSLVVTKGITIIGQTTVDSAAGTANDQTIILDRTGSVSDQMLIYLNTSLGKTYRISGITFRTGQTTRANSNGMIYISGTQGASSHAVRVDHCHFDDLAYEGEAIGVWTAVYGVIDHNLFYYKSGVGNAVASVNMPDWGGQTQGYGSYADPAYYGSEKFIFIEDNYINDQTGTRAGAIDGQRGGRYVYRHNHVYNSWATNHGTEIGPYRGLRCFEVYNNDFHWNWAPNGATSSRSGGMICYNNTNSGTFSSKPFAIAQYRDEQTFGPPFAGSTGNNAWDFNDTSNGTFTNCANPVLTGAVSPTSNTGTFNYSPVNGLYASGTVSSGSTTTLTDTTKSWQTNQWAGFTAKRVSDNAVMEITSNTATTLTGYYNPGYSNPLNWSTGGQYQIHRPLVSLDQPGRGKGDLVTGSQTAVNSTTGTVSWIHQQLEPCYSWNDLPITLGSTGLQTSIEGVQTVRANRDFFNPVGGIQTDSTHPFNGAVGTGFGTHANRPTTCTPGTDISGSTPNAPGVGYWETDTNTFFVCTAPNTWTLWYQPYTYPHPLVSGASPSTTPSAPQNLRVIGP